MSGLEDVNVEHMHIKLETASSSGTESLAGNYGSSFDSRKKEIDLSGPLTDIPTWISNVELATSDHGLALGVKGGIKSDVRAPKWKAKKQTITCSVCMKILASQKSLNRHMQCRHPSLLPVKEKFTCLKCSHTCSSAMRLERHELVHAGFWRYACSMCDKKFRDKSGYTRHKHTHTGARPFKCTECDHTFTRVFKLNSHRLMKHNIGNFKKLVEVDETIVITADNDTSVQKQLCDSCGTTFWLKGSIETLNYLHRLKESKEATTSNKELMHYCGASFDSEDALLGHMLYCNFEHAFECPKCEKKRKMVKRRRFQEIVSVSNTVQHLCSVCGESFRDNWGLVKHEFRLHGRTADGADGWHHDLRYACMYCGKKLRTRDGLLEHERAHTGVKGFACVVCDLKFVRKSALLKHTKAHIDGECMKCVECEDVFESSIKLKEHRTSVHGFQEKELDEKTNSNDAYNHVCEICGKKCSNQSRLTNHKKIHSDIYSYKCVECCASFHRHSGLYKHRVRVHGLERRRKLYCTYCVKIFTSRTELNKHEESHSEYQNSVGKRIWTCQICNNIFPKKSRLKRHHLVKHIMGIDPTNKPANIQPCHCDICGRQFSRRECLIQHMPIHSGERPFGCTQCGKRFVRKANLQTHQLTHRQNRRERLTKHASENGDLLTCSQCKKQFDKIWNLKVHELTHENKIKRLCERDDENDQLCEDWKNDKHPGSSANGGPSLSHSVERRRGRGTDNGQKPQSIPCIAQSSAESFREQPRDVSKPVLQPTCPAPVTQHSNDANAQHVAASFGDAHNCRFNTELATVVHSIQNPNFPDVKDSRITAESVRSDIMNGRSDTSRMKQTAHSFNGSSQVPYDDNDDNNYGNGYEDGDDTAIASNSYDSPYPIHPQNSSSLFNPLTCLNQFNRFDNPQTFLLQEQLLDATTLNKPLLMSFTRKTVNNEWNTHNLDNLLNTKLNTSVQLAMSNPIGSVKPDVTSGTVQHAQMINYDSNHRLGVVAASQSSVVNQKELKSQQSINQSINQPRTESDRSHTKNNILNKKAATNSKRLPEKIKNANAEETKLLANKISHKSNNVQVGQKQSHRCSVCGKEFLRKTQLQLHARVRLH